ncbi:hypothetical protein MB84_26700 [Pandoraea oxalativorans]|uniref:Uncharacterized protein n=1 Tax=Pandoraea oxalativorans TaxID=573737 RepID=A0A0G3IB82_9BURK|nr:hypothetical protein MB84_26700 [Pandoraea oxalativorans]
MQGASDFDAVMPLVQLACHATPDVAKRCHILCRESHFTTCNASHGAMRSADADRSRARSAFAGREVTGLSYKTLDKRPGNASRADTIHAPCHP